jgi:serine/threonine-protein kinase RsbW
VHLEVAVCLPQEAVSVALVRGAVTDILVLFGVEQGCIDDVRLAVSEACTNVVRHAGGDDEYEVRLRIDDDRCAISVRDAGHGFDAAALSGVMPSADSARGRGVSIMRAVMSSVQLDSSPEDGTVVNLVTTLSGRPDGPFDQLRRRSRAAPERPR